MGGVPLSDAHGIALSVLVWSGPTNFILVAPGAWEPPLQFTGPGGRENGANDVLEVATDFRDPVAVQRKVSNAPNHVQDLSLDCHDPSSSIMFSLVAPEARESSIAFQGPWQPKHRYKQCSGPRHGQEGAHDLPKEAQKRCQSCPVALYRPSSYTMFILVAPRAWEPFTLFHGP